MSASTFHAVTLARDGCVVDTGPLTDILHGFVTRWNRDRPRSSGQFSSREASDQVSHVSAVGWLAAETGLAEGTIQNIVGGRVPTTELRIADRLVTALERPDLWHDGTLTIRPNPSATREAQRLCCGGCET